MVLIKKKKSKVQTPKCNFSNNSLHIRCLIGIFFMVMELMSVAYVGLPGRDTEISGMEMKFTDLQKCQAN